MKRPVRTTIVFGAVSALAVMPTALVLSGVVGWHPAFKLVLWLDLALYAMLLVRWSGRGLGPALFPLALLLGAALWPAGAGAFFLIGLGVLAWIRSGVCFTDAPLRALAAEILTVAGGAGLVALLRPSAALAWALGVWLFFLVQALYFYLVPAARVEDRCPPATDPFVQAEREALRVLDGVG
ncbi:MAG: hypothetical protein V2L15_04980 [Desulfobacteraceae bacterium]|jgi:hypothetical protein|nr:hypothetical protein [Desulfobacteraceae bacterium]